MEITELCPRFYYTFETYGAWKAIKKGCEPIEVKLGKGKTLKCYTNMRK